MHVLMQITFSKDGSIPETGDVVIEDGKLGEAILESQIGKHGVSPATKKSLTSRLYNLMNQKANDH
ncbi:putative chalcone isomerase [Helianthus debilis subsp. tardiflorus]